MRRCIVLIGLCALPVLATAGPVDAVARVARTRANAPLTLSFQPEPCTLTGTTTDGAARVPLRKVSWSMTKETDGTGDAIVTARCAKGAACVTGAKADAPRFSFRLATGAREARAMLRDLKVLASKCS